MTAAILGVAGFAWFGWAREDPPASGRVRLGTGSVVSLLTGVVGAVLAWLDWAGASALVDAGAGRAFGVVVGMEVLLAAAGAIWLARIGRHGS